MVVLSRCWMRDYVSFGAHCEVALEFYLKFIGAQAP